MSGIQPCFKRWQRPINVASSKRSKRGRRSRQQPLERHIRVYIFRELQVKVLRLRRRTNGKRLGELNTHALCKAVTHPKRQLGSTNTALNGANELKVSQKCKAIVFLVGNTKPKNLCSALRHNLRLNLWPTGTPVLLHGLSYLRSYALFLHIRHERTPINTLSTFKVWQTAHPVQEVNVQSGVVTSSSARRYSRCR